MKKVISFVAIAAITIFVASCGNNEAAKKLADSLRQDSIDKATKAQMDSIHAANSKDSADKAAAEAAKKQHWADSMRQDSMDKAEKGGAKGGKKPAAKPTPKVENKKATKGRG